MKEEESTPRAAGGLARFVIAVAALLLMLAGVVLIIAADSGMLWVDVLDTTVNTPAPGLIVFGLGILVLFRSGRRVPRGDDEHDPDSHLPFPRDAMHDDER